MYKMLYKFLKLSGTSLKLSPNPIVTIIVLPNPVLSSAGNPRKLYFLHMFKKTHFLGFLALFMEREWVHSIPREKLHLGVYEVYLER